MIETLILKLSLNSVFCFSEADKILFANGLCLYTASHDEGIGAMQKSEPNFEFLILKKDEMSSDHFVVYRT